MGGTVAAGAGIVAPFVTRCIGRPFLIVPTVGDGVGLGKAVEVFRPWEGGDRIAQGGEVQFTAPLALAVTAAAVGTHLHGVGGIRGESREGIWIFCNINRSVAAHLNLPCRSRTRFRPAQHNRISGDI